MRQDIEDVPIPLLLTACVLSVAAMVGAGIGFLIDRLRPRRHQ